MKYSNRLVLTTAVSALLVAPLAQAAQTYNGYYDDTPEIFGAIVGAVVGNQFSHGKGRGWTTAAGALLGWSIGYDMAYINHGYENIYIDEFADDYIDEPRVDYFDEPMDDYSDEPVDDYIDEL